MKQLKENVLCYYCIGCNKLINENFKGQMNCKNFIQGRDMKEFYKKIKEVEKNGV